jgi:transposase
MALSTFCIMMNGSNKARYFKVRKQIVQHAQKFGIKPTAKKWAISKNTVKTWLRRFLHEGNQGLYDKRKGPLNIPHKTPAEIEKKVIDARLQVPCYGPKRLKYFFELPCGENAIARILKQHNLSKKPKKKYQIKNDLREAKARYKALGHMQMDVKYLKDIPNYWGQKKRFKLPCFEYTLRDTKSGMLFLGFSDELSELNARSFLHYALKGLRKHIPLEKIIIQTDNVLTLESINDLGKRPSFWQTCQFKDNLAA